jgi:hypothetical protein
LAKLAALAALIVALIAPSLAGAAEPEIRTDDVDRFYRVYAAANGRPAAEVLQRDYLDHASPGLIQLAKVRNITAERMAKAIETRPRIYEDARRCAAHLPRAKARLGQALRKLGEIYPQARFPAVTVVVGRGNPVGVGDTSGVYIGLEALCAWTTPDPNEEDRLVHVIAHEYIHVQQAAFAEENPEDSVLRVSLTEGVAEFLGELISGSVAYKHLAAAGRGREAEYEAAFAKDIDRKAQGSAWVYNGLGTPERPGDLGYWIGYRIAKAYYVNAPDKAAAIREIIELRDEKALLARSGWSPGVDLTH